MMKPPHHALVLLLFLTVPQIVMSQNANPDTTVSQPPVDSKEKQAGDETVKLLTKRLDEFESRLKSVEAEQEVVVGTLRLRSDRVTIGKCGSESGGCPTNQQFVEEVVTINEVYIRVKNGFIYSIVVKAGSYVFMNQDAPIELSTRRINLGDNLIGYAPTLRGAEVRINTREFLEYVSYKPHVPDDDDGFVFNPSTDNTSRDFKKGVGIDRAITFDLFSDALGMLGSDGNGLLQTDVSFKSIMNRTNIPNRRAIPVHHFQANMTLRRFDGDIGVLTDSAYTRINLLQQSWIQTETMLNVLTWYYDRSSLNSLQLNVGGSINQGRYQDSTRTRNVHTSAVVFTLEHDWVSAENFGSRLAYRAQWNSAPSNFARISGEKDKVIGFHRPSFLFYWNPLGKRESRIFARASATYPMLKQASFEPFFEFQFGYSSQISSLFK